MKNKILFLSLALSITTIIFADDVKINVAVPVEKPTIVDTSVEANLPRTESDFAKYSGYWKKQPKEVLSAEIEKLQEYIILEGAKARKSKLEYEKACINYVPNNDSEKLAKLREKEKELDKELKSVRNEIRKEIVLSPDLKVLYEKNLRNDLNVRHARLALSSLLEIQKEEK